MEGRRWSAEEVHDRHVEGVCDSRERRQRQVDLPRFDTAEVAIRHPKPGGECLLREASVGAQLRHAAADGTQKLSSPDKRHGPACTESAASEQGLICSGRRGTDRQLLRKNINSLTFLIPPGRIR